MTLPAAFSLSGTPSSVISSRNFRLNMYLFGQQDTDRAHQAGFMHIGRRFIFAFVTSMFAIALNGCSGIIKQKDTDRPVLLKTESATIEQLESEVDRQASIPSLRAKMDLKFEDNSFAELGIAEKYRTADAELIVQRPSKIFLKIQAPIAIASLDIAQMTSDGEKFRVAILEDGGSGKNRKFVMGTNAVDYSPLQEKAQSLGDSIDKELLQKVNAFANIRPQHFTEAMMMRPIDKASYLYSMSAIFQEETDATKPGKSPLRRVLRGYYLLDEYVNDGGALGIKRRFWFDRVGGIRLARQQIFDSQRELEADISYGLEGKLTDGPGYERLPLQIQVTRPKEKYNIRLSYQSPAFVQIGLTLKPEIFVLKNDKNLPMVDLDEKLRELKTATPK